MADYKHGSMDLAEHRRTFRGFMNLVVVTSVVVALVLIFLAMVGT